MARRPSTNAAVSLHRRRRALLAVATVLVAMTAANGATAQPRDGRVRSMVGQALEEYQGGEIDGALVRLRLALNACTPRVCTRTTRASVHIAIGVIEAEGSHDGLAATRSFVRALELDGNARVPAGLMTNAVRTSFANAQRQIGLEPTTEPPEPAPAPAADAPVSTAPVTDSESAGGAPPSASSAASESTTSDTYRFAIDVGGGVGLAWLSGTPQYDEYREWDMRGSGNFTCGRPRSDGTDSLRCPTISNPGFAYEGFVYAALRANLLRRVGIAVSVRFQPDAASVGILPSLFIGARLLVTLNGSGFVKRGFVAAVFLGSGFGQMQATPPVSSGTPAHVISGLNNLHAGLHLEYGLRVVHIGAALTLNLQIPNVLFVADLQAFAGVHF